MELDLSTFLFMLSRFYVLFKKSFPTPMVMKIFRSRNLRTFTVQGKITYRVTVEREEILDSPGCANA